MTQNPLGLRGIEFVEFSVKEPQRLELLFQEFGFSKTARHREFSIDLYQQGEISLLLNYASDTFGARFESVHGPCISAMGWRFENPEEAHREAVRRGAQPCEKGDYLNSQGRPIPAIFGIGESLIYFVKSTEDLGLRPLPSAAPAKSKGFLKIDHLTNNVFKGTMQKWASFYKDIFGFDEVRYFDIKGLKTGLTSYALRSPSGQFCIPINEADEAKSQINEYLDEYKGPGVQHLAFLTEDLVSSLRALKGTSIQTLDIGDHYYEKAFARVPRLREDPRFQEIRKSIMDLNILVDGDEDGYLLQIFTKNLVGPIFIELIQRENHRSFGEGNFQALFDSIERDQMRRGVL